MKKDETVYLRHILNRMVSPGNGEQNKTADGE